jgi:erythromycin esterase-like protein
MEAGFRRSIRCWRISTAWSPSTPRSLVRGWFRWSRKFARPSFNEANEAYSSLPEADRLALAAYVAELADRIASLRHFYAARSAIEDYEWASAIAENLRGANAMLVNFEARNRPESGLECARPDDGRERRWIRSREAGVVVLAHNAHVQRAKSVQVLPSQAVQGMFLASMFGDGYKSIGFTFNQGTMAGKPGGELTLPLADSTSIDGVLARVGKPLFLLDLQKVPPGPAREWLNRPVKQRIQNVVTEYNQLESWNAVIFVDSIAPTRFP